MERAYIRREDGEDFELPQHFRMEDLFPPECSPSFVVDDDVIELKLIGGAARCIVAEAEFEMHFEFYDPDEEEYEDEDGIRGTSSDADLAIGLIAYVVDRLTAVCGEPIVWEGS